MKTAIIHNNEELSSHPYETFIKYMGSKAKILDFVTSGINEVYLGGYICDLFAGSACLSGALGKQAPFISNDIQSYSGILAEYYLNAYKSSKTPSVESLILEAKEIVNKVKKSIPKDLEYFPTESLAEFNKIELRNQKLISRLFDHKYHLFLKYYSGTWWSADQCMWIDAIRQVADRYKNTSTYSIILCSLMHAVAYCSQGTGHFAQYRDAKTASSLKDILIYRTRDLSEYFIKKYTKSTNVLSINPSSYDHEITSEDYIKRLKTLPKNTTIYADPPYCFVHYSRFYHALETLVKYDYPKIQEKSGKVVKGRYREGRHQSPFSIRTQVTKAFEGLFGGIVKSKSNLVLSYSNTGMITLDQLLQVAKDTLGTKYNIDIVTQNYKHMTMGRKEDRSRDVKEGLILFDQKN